MAAGPEEAVIGEAAPEVTAAIAVAGTARMACGDRIGRDRDAC
jgi:hypothetical protein